MRTYKKIITLFRNLPSTANFGWEYHCEDTGEIYIGQGISLPLKYVGSQKALQHPVNFANLINLPQLKVNRHNLSYTSFSDANYDISFNASCGSIIKFNEKYYMIHNNSISIATSKDLFFWNGKLLNGYRNTSNNQQFDSTNIVNINEANGKLFLTDSRCETEANYSHVGDGELWTRCLVSANPITFSGGVVYNEQTGIYYAQNNGAIYSSTDSINFTSLANFNQRTSRIKLYKNRFLMGISQYSDIECYDTVNNNSTEITISGGGGTGREMIITNNDHIIVFSDTQPDQDIIDVDLRKIFDRGSIGDCSYVLSSIQSRMEFPKSISTSINANISFDYGVCKNEPLVYGSLIFYVSVNNGWIYYSRDHGTTWDILWFDNDYPLACGGLPNGMYLDQERSMIATAGYDSGVWLLPFFFDSQQ